MPDNKCTRTLHDLALTLQTRVSMKQKNALVGHVQSVCDLLQSVSQEIWQLQLSWPDQRELVERAERAWFEVNGLLRCINYLSVEGDHPRTQDGSSDQG